ncbi:VWA domain-containing protein [Mesorhizobium sp. VNQ89]|uniref:vWA domain-containing protein n=1 Tax=Mesorhizobium quangtriensis TaxID=3157709 RepID=UPI0032B79DEF
MRFLSRGTIAALLLGCAVASGHAAERTIIVFDASGSMWGQVDGKPKQLIARDTLRNVLQTVPSGAEFGLIAYGHREKGSCTDIELVVPPATGTASAITQAVDGLKFLGKTPLTAAVRQAADALKYTEDKATVVLITDGVESCEADPCALGRELEQAGVDFTAHVVGFGLTADEGREVACLAESTGGKYLQASDAEGLREALASTVVASPEPAAPQPASPAPAAPEPAPPVATPAEPAPAAPAAEPAPPVAETPAAEPAAPQPPAEPATPEPAPPVAAPTEPSPAEPVPTPPVAAQPQAEPAAPVPATPETPAPAPQPAEPAAAPANDAAIDAGHVTVNALYAPAGARVEASGLDVRIFKARPNADGTREQVAYSFGAASKFDIAPGDHVAVVKLDQVEVEQPFNIRAGETKDVTAVLNAGILEISAPNAKDIRVLAATRDAQGERKQFGQGFGGPYRTTLPAGDYVVTTDRRDGSAVRETAVRVRLGGRTELTIE